jgi:hypothetical protein
MHPPGIEPGSPAYCDSTCQYDSMCVLHIVLGSCVRSKETFASGVTPTSVPLFYCDMAGRYSTTRPWMPAIICGFYQMRYITSAKYVC